MENVPIDSYTYNYLFIGVFLLVAIIFPLLPILLAKVIAPKKPSPSKQDIYECGLESKGDPWVSFKAQYYVYALAFVAFDLETPFIYAWAVVFNKLPIFAFIEMLIFIAVLAAGLVYAWSKGVLEWE